MHEHGGARIRSRPRSHPPRSQVLSPLGPGFTWVTFGRHGSRGQPGLRGFLQQVARDPAFLRDLIACISCSSASQRAAFRRTRWASWCSRHGRPSDPTARRVATPCHRRPRNEGDLHPAIRRSGIATRGLERNNELAKGEARRSGRLCHLSSSSEQDGIAGRLMGPNAISRRACAPWYTPLAGDHLDQLMFPSDRAGRRNPTARLEE